MKEPEISVGIVNAQEIHFSLNGNFFAKGIIRKSKCSRVSKRKVHFTKRSV